MISIAVVCGVVGTILGIIVLAQSKLKKLEGWGLVVLGVGLALVGR